MGTRKHSKVQWASRQSSAANETITSRNRTINFKVCKCLRGDFYKLFLERGVYFVPTELVTTILFPFCQYCGGVGGGFSYVKEKRREQRVTGNTWLALLTRCHSRTLYANIVCQIKEMKDGIGSISRQGVEGKHWHSWTRSHIAPDVVAPSQPVKQWQWANLPPELLLDIIRRVEESETSWPARTVVVFCASVCKSWRDITKEIVWPLEECGRLTFPISLKQPGPRDSPIQCFIKRDRKTSTYHLYFGLTPSEDQSDKLLLAAKKIRRATSTEFVISLVGDDFSQASNTYLGKLRSNFLGTKFTVYDSQPPNDAVVQHNSLLSRRFHSKRVSPRLPARNNSAATVSYELNVLRTRGPRRMHCIMHSIPVSSIREGGAAPTPTSFSRIIDEKSSPRLVSKGKEPETYISSPNLSSFGEPLVLRNKAPRWHEQLQCWCLNFKGRVTVASVKNFQLVATVDPSLNVPAAEQEKVILQFGKIGKDIFTMDYIATLFLPSKLLQLA